MFKKKRQTYSSGGGGTPDVEKSTVVTNIQAQNVGVQHVSMTPQINVVQSGQQGGWGRDLPYTPTLAARSPASMQSNLRRAASEGQDPVQSRGRHKTPPTRAPIPEFQKTSTFTTQVSSTVHQAAAQTSSMLSSLPQQQQQTAATTSSSSSSPRKQKLTTSAQYTSPASFHGAPMSILEALTAADWIGFQGAVKACQKFCPIFIMGEPLNDGYWNTSIDFVVENCHVEVLEEHPLVMQNMGIIFDAVQKNCGSCNVGDWRYDTSVAECATWHLTDQEKTCQPANEPARAQGEAKSKEEALAAVDDEGTGGIIARLHELSENSQSLMSWAGMATSKVELAVGGTTKLLELFREVLTKGDEEVYRKVWKYVNRGETIAVLARPTYKLTSKQRLTNSANAPPWMRGHPDRVKCIRHENTESMKSHPWVTRAAMPVLTDRIYRTVMRSSHQAQPSNLHGLGISSGASKTLPVYAMVIPNVQWNKSTSKFERSMQDWPPGAHSIEGFDFQRGNFVITYYMMFPFNRGKKISILMSVLGSHVGDIERVVVSVRDGQPDCVVIKAHSLPDVSYVFPRVHQQQQSTTTSGSGGGGVGGVKFYQEPFVDVNPFVPGESSDVDDNDNQEEASSSSSTKKSRKSKLYVGDSVLRPRIVTSNVKTYKYHTTKETSCMRFIRTGYQASAYRPIVHVARGSHGMRPNHGVYQYQSSVIVGKDMTDSCGNANKDVTWFDPVASLNLVVENIDSWPSDIDRRGLTLATDHVALSSSSSPTQPQQTSKRQSASSSSSSSMSTKRASGRPVEMSGGAPLNVVMSNMHMWTDIAQWGDSEKQFDKQVVIAKLFVGLFYEKAARSMTNLEKGPRGFRTRDPFNYIWADKRLKFWSHVFNAMLQPEALTLPSRVPM